jgi:hypothetical protein
MSFCKDFNAKTSELMVLSHPHCYMDPNPEPHNPNPEAYTLNSKP